MTKQPDPQIIMHAENCASFKSVLYACDCGHAARTKEADSKTTGKTPFMVHCGKCDHKWAAAYMPMEITLFANILDRVCCPICGTNSTKIFTGQEKAG